MSICQSSEPANITLSGKKKKKVKTVFCSLPSASVGTGSSMLPTPQCGHQNPQMLEPLIQNALAGQSVLCILGFLTCPQMQNPLVQRANRTGKDVIGLNLKATVLHYPGGPYMSL